MMQKTTIIKAHLALNLKLNGFTIKYIAKHFHVSGAAVYWWLSSLKNQKRKEKEARLKRIKQRKPKKIPRGSEILEWMEETNEDRIDPDSWPKLMDLIDKMPKIEENRSHLDPEPIV